MRHLIPHLARFGALLLVALAAPAQEPLHQVCQACHTTPAEDFRTHPHLENNLDCDTCHGPSQAHRESSGAAAPDRIAAPHQVAELCGTCHIGQAAAFNQNAHGKLVAAMSDVRAPNCGTCHDVHRLRPARAMERRCTRCHQQLPAACAAEPQREAALRCAGCHQPHHLGTQD